MAADDAAGIAKLAAYVHAAPGDSEVADSYAEAWEMVANRTKPENVRAGGVPAVIVARAVKEVGADLFHRRTSRNGIAGLDGGPDSFTPLRIARDPMKAAADILAPYMLPGIG